MRTFAQDQLSGYLQVERAAELESELYKYAVDEVQVPYADWDHDCVRQMYKHKLRALLTALRSTNVAARLKDAKTDLREMLYMSPSEIYPDIWNEVVQAAQEASTPQPVNEERYGEAACTSCLRRGQPAHQTVYSQLQTRSADEGLTTYFLCYNCGKRWRQS